MKRTLAVLALVGLVAFAGYYFFVRDTVVTAHLRGLELAATIGSGEDAVAVSANGKVLRWLTLPEDLDLPELPLSEPPKGKRVKGPVAQQARVLGAVPPALRSYVANSRYGESGVDVELDSGIELRFGDASQAARKWKAAAAVLADPTIEALDYVNLTRRADRPLTAKGTFCHRFPSRSRLQEAGFTRRIQPSGPRFDLRVRVAKPSTQDRDSGLAGCRSDV